MTLWTDTRDFWVVTILDADVLRVVAWINEHYGLTDENEGDRTETRESILWLMSQGAKGRDWGHCGVAAEALGMFPFASEGGER